MASAHPITTSRSAQFSVGSLHLLLGLALTIFLNHFIRDFSILPAKWYDSYWLPLVVACATYSFEAMFVRLPAKWLYGLLITAPPYGWHACLATLVYFQNRTDTTLTEYLKIALPALLLGLSGAFLSPIIARLIPVLFSSPAATALSKQ